MPSRVDSVTSWTVACQAPLSTGFSRQEHWSGLPCPPPGGHPHAGTKPASHVSPALVGGVFTTSTSWEAPRCCTLEANTMRINWTLILKTLISVLLDKYLEVGLLDHSSSIFNFFEEISYCFPYLSFLTSTIAFPTMVYKSPDFSKCLLFSISA